MAPVLPQSRRGGAALDAAFARLQSNPHALECFRQLAANEEQLADGWMAFYHLYSLSAVLYELNAAVAGLLFGFSNHEAPLPRLFWEPFASIGSAKELKACFNAGQFGQQQDHHELYRKVGLSAMCSLAATGPEADVCNAFLTTSFNNTDLSYPALLKGIVVALGLGEQRAESLAGEIIALANQHGLHNGAFGGGSWCRWGTHLLQIFVREDLVDALAYSSHPYGAPDDARSPLSSWMASGANLSIGQARVFCDPELFTRSSCVQLRVASADPKFHAGRRAFQQQLLQLLASAMSGNSLLWKQAALRVRGSDEGIARPNLFKLLRGLKGRAVRRSFARRRRALCAPVRGRRRVRAPRSQPCAEAAQWCDEEPRQCISDVQHLWERSCGPRARGAAGQVRGRRFPFVFSEEVAVGDRRFVLRWRRAEQVAPCLQKPRAAPKWRAQDLRKARRQRARARGRRWKSEQQMWGAED